jgi:K+-transporting ATPase ATPase C chain
MRHLLPSVLFKIFMTVLLGIGYPLLMTGLAQIIFPKQASGEFVSQNGKFVGAKLIGQKFESPQYFWSRPSSGDYNPLPSGGSNLGPTAQDLKKVFEERKAKVKAAHPDQSGEPPQELLFASASGLDPHISPQTALYQVERVSKARHMTYDQVKTLVTQAVEKRQFGFMGDDVVNVLMLNRALDSAQGTRPQENSH